MESMDEDKQNLLSTDDEKEEERNTLLSPVSDDGDDPSPSKTLPQAPKDRFNAVYITFVVVAVGMLFPWNTFILAIDYFRFLYPDKHVENVIPYTNLIITLLMVTLTLCVVKLIPVHFRILSGYCVFIVVLLLVPLLDIGINNCTISTDVGFILTVMFVALVAFGGGVQQASFYGLAGMLPPRFTQALMLGESIAGFVVSVLRIITKSASKSEREGAIAFFVIGLLYIVSCVFGQVFIYRSKFVKHHVKLSSVQVIDSVKVPNGDGNIQDSAIIKRYYCTPFDKTRITGPLYASVRVMKQIWRIALSVFITLLVTLLIFPGLSSDVQYCSIGDWPPVINAAVFNIFDMISRMVVIFLYCANPNIILLCSCLRVILVPLFVLCVSPTPSNPVVDHPLWAGIVLIAIVGATNGSLATISMVQGPMSVASLGDREIAGNLMVLFLLLGLTVGSILAVGLTPLTELGEVIQCINSTSQFHCNSTL